MIFKDWSNYTLTLYKIKREVRFIPRQLIAQIEQRSVAFVSNVLEQTLLLNVFCKRIDHVDVVEFAIQSDG